LTAFLGQWLLGADYHVHRLTEQSFKRRLQLIRSRHLGDFAMLINVDQDRHNTPLEVGDGNLSR
jgi:hypothetical protein